MLNYRKFSYIFLCSQLFSIEEDDPHTYEIDYPAASLSEGQREDAARLFLSLPYSEVVMKAGTEEENSYGKTARHS